MGIHGPLSWLIRLTGGVLAMLFGTGSLIYAVVGTEAFIKALADGGAANSLIYALIIFLIMAPLPFVAWAGWRMVCKIDETAVINFAFVMAFLVAVITYRLLRGVWVDSVSIPSEFMLLLLCAFFSVVYLLLRKCFLNWLKRVQKTLD